MNRFWKLTEAEVTSMQEEARKATALRADINRRRQEAMEAICGLNNSMTVEEALKAFRAADDEEREIPIPAYIAPVKRWAGGKADLDAWYWDRP